MENALVNLPALLEDALVNLIALLEDLRESVHDVEHEAAAILQLMDENIPNRPYVHLLDDMLNIPLGMLGTVLGRLENILIAVGLDMQDNPDVVLYQVTHNRTYNMIVEIEQIIDNILTDRNHML